MPRDLNRNVHSQISVSSSVHMHHPVQESPEEHVGEQAAHETTGKEQTSGLEALVPPPASFQDEQHGQQEGRQEVEDEPVQACEPQDARCGPGQSRHRGPAVLQHRGVPSHRDLADELRALAFSCDRRHSSPKKSLETHTCTVNTPEYERLKRARDYLHLPSFIYIIISFRFTLRLLMISLPWGSGCTRLRNDKLLRLQEITHKRTICSRQY